MEMTLVSIVGVSSIVAVAAFSKRLGLAAPLSLVVVGIALSFVPGVPALAIEPEWVLAGVLPPLLYSAAVNMPASDFRRNLGSISGLAVLLVAVTTLGAGWLFHWLMPGLGWPAAFALGAVVSPTDAVAATSMGRQLGLPSRLLTMLEGEGLVNDASALVLLRSAIAAMAGTVSLGGVAGNFVFSVAVAAAVGIVVGLVNVRVRALLGDSLLNTAISFIVPFVAFLPAEEFHASGVLAVVVAGLVTGHQSPRFLSAQDRLTEAMNWRTLAFLLESAVFLLMGLGLKSLLDEVAAQGLSATRALLIGLAAAALVIVARMVFVAPLIAFARRDAQRAAEKKPRLDWLMDRLGAPEADGGITHLRSRRVLSPRRRQQMIERVTRASADADFKVNENLGWRSGVALAWAGMRGAITVAAAQTLPEDTPYRPQLLLIAFVVATTTLLLQGLTLPAVIRAVKVPGDDPERLREERRLLLAEVTAAGRSVVEDPDLARGDGSPYSEAVVAKVREDARLYDTGTVPALDGEREQYVDLRLGVIAIERDAVLAARSTGVYGSQTINQAQLALDLDEARLQRLGDLTGK
ncbi:cation:proton antiporter [Streptomyces sp. H34-S4]|uniref:cation:proton antiporter n=1 Tax=Streptomyces sp. H34-S4 TaxID=2996463 RepID=UPI00226EA898|nr:cation:proton antiporter [Streptomyces sp. H34-S4]MCY0938812.1 cation:proton antiporter [Streptomyces sp. H34-S4]